MLILSAAVAMACDDAVFRALPEPAIPEGGKGVITGDASMNGAAVVGARFEMHSDVSLAVWKRILHDAELQDEWLPERFGYDLVERIDPRHMYLQVDVGFLFGAVHIRRQLVAEIREVEGGGAFTSCWSMVDHQPFAAELARLQNDADWERASAGWWNVRPSGSGGDIGYQWWTEAGHVPSGLLKYGATQTLPALLDAFETRARALARGSGAAPG